MKDNVCKTKLKQQKCNALTIMMVLSIVVDFSSLLLLLLFVIGASVAGIEFHKVQLLINNMKWNKKFTDLANKSR